MEQHRIRSFQLPKDEPSVSSVPQRRARWVTIIVFMTCRLLGTVGCAISDASIKAPLLVAACKTYDAGYDLTTNTSLDLRIMLAMKWPSIATTVEELQTDYLA